MSLVFQLQNGRPGIDCPICGQAVRVDRHRDTYRFNCYGGHTDSELSGLIDPAVMLELASETANGRGGASSLIDFAEIVARPVRWAWEYRVALAKITALAGRPKIGKGFVYSDLTARVTRGDLAGDLDGPRNVILVTTEDDSGDTLKPRLMAAGADLPRVSIFQMGSKDEPVPFRVPQDADELGRRIVEKEAALVVIDPLMEFIDAKVDSHKSHPVRRALAALNRMARYTDCAVLVIFHLNKGVSSDPLLRHEGSAAFTQVVRGGLMLGHDPDDPAEQGNQRVLAVSASNLAPMVESIAYRIETRHVDGDTGQTITTARAVPIGGSSATSQDLLRSHDSEERTERDDAKDFLQVELADGPSAAKELKASARDAGISERTLARARSELKVESKRVGGAGNAGHWEWSLTQPPPNGLLSTRGAGTLSANPHGKGDLADSNPLRVPLHNGGPLRAETDRPAPPCTCLRPSDVTTDGRCGRCWGKVPAEWRSAP